MAVKLHAIVVPLNKEQMLLTEETAVQPLSAM